MLHNWLTLNSVGASSKIRSEREETAAAAVAATVDRSATRRSWYTVWWCCLKRKKQIRTRKEEDGLCAQLEKMNRVRRERRYTLQCDQNQRR